MSVAIITLNSDANFGNRLQNYALQEVIKKNNLEVITLLNETRVNRSKGIIENKNSLQRFLEMSFKDKKNALIYKLNWKKMDEENKNRKAMFSKFTDKYIKQTSYSITNKNIPENLGDEFEYFISGSDQVWNYTDSLVSEVNFMTFAPKEKRLTYAPSFGVSEISKEYKEDYTKWLNGIDNISVREDAGAKIVKDLTGKDALVVVDPTMLLTKEEWLKISRVHENKPKEKYLLTYFLGEMPKEVKQKIKSVSKSNKLKVVNLAQIKDKKYYLADPSEFIDYINDAEVFVTDSFHGCVFSLLMDTPLVVCDRLGQTSATSMSSRIETFVNKFYIQDRQFKNIKDEEIFKTNYKKAYEVLEVERKKSFDYLESILKVKVTQ